jgi:hypothetical protein
MLQNVCSLVAAQVLAPPPGARVLDMCAAPGGKTTALAQLMRNQGEVRGAAGLMRPGFCAAAAAKFTASVSVSVSGSCVLYRCASRRMQKCRPWA